MAKATGPLMSLDASGGFASTMVFGKWKGRNTVRQLVTPSNPRSLGQEVARSAIRVTAIAQRWANLTLMVYPGETETDKTRLIAAAPPNQAWNGYLISLILGTGNANIEASDAAWAVLSAPQKTAWDNAAAALTPAMGAAYQTVAGGIATTSKTAGNVFFNYVWGLYVGALATLPGTVPPVYA